MVMPDHIHGIVILHDSVETQDFASLPRVTHNIFGPQSKNIPSIIRGFKIGVTKYVNEHAVPFKWQPRYYDRIIRTPQELLNVRKYIYNNPKNPVKFPNLSSII